MKLHVHPPVVDNGETWVRATTDRVDVWRRAKGGWSARHRAIRAAISEHLAAEAAAIRAGGTLSLEVLRMFMGDWKEDATRDTALVVTEQWGDST